MYQASHCRGKKLYPALVCKEHKLYQAVVDFGAWYKNCTRQWYRLYPALTFSYYISRMQGSHFLLRRSHPYQEGTKGPLTGKIFCYAIERSHTLALAKNHTWTTTKWFSKLGGIYVNQTDATYAHTFKALTTFCTFNNRFQVNNERF